MILADTTIWVDRFRKMDAVLYQQLQRKNISTRPFVVAELALGNLTTEKIRLLLSIGFRG